MTTLAPPESLADRFARANREQRRAALAQLPPERRLQLARGETPWWFYGRNDQMEPTSWAWRWWLILAGRGFGKTRTGGQWLTGRARRYPGCRMALVAPTFADGRDTMVEGVSGMLSHTDFTQLRGGSVETGWNRSLGELFFANGSKARIFSSENPWRLRGPAHHFVWGDEPAYWRDVAAGVVKDSTFFNANVSMREKARAGWDEHYRPAGVLTTTPRFVPLLKVPEDVLAVHPDQAGLVQRTDVATTTGTTWANLRNLDPAYYAAVVAPLIGTTIGLQELGGVLLEQVEGALWRLAQIVGDRRPAPPADQLNETVVAFDPAGGGGPGHAEHGIIAAASAGPQATMHAYVLEDRSGNMLVEHAAIEVITLAAEVGASAIVFEKNQGQDWIPATIRSTFDAILSATEPGEGDADDMRRRLWAAHEALPPGWALPPVVPVSADRNKAERARLPQQLSQQHRVHHVRAFPVLESQQTTWVPGESDSPDRLDAMVWAILRLYGQAHGETSVASPASRERRGRRPNMPSSRLPAVYGTRGQRR